MLPLTSRCLSTLLALYALTPAALSNKPTSPTSRHNVYNYNTFNAGPNKEMKKLLLEIKTQLTDLQKTVNGIQGTKPIGKVYKNCAELYKSGQRISGVYTIYPDDEAPFDVYCDQTTAGGGWTVIQKRLNGYVDFNRTWDDYKYGFGNFLTGEYWLGLEKIRRLTENKTDNRLRVVLGVNDTKLLVPTNTLYAEYAWLKIGDEGAKYQLDLGNITNKTVFGDSLSYHDGFEFGTFDKDVLKCASKNGGGWWYNPEYETCVVNSNLNAVYNRNISWGMLDPANAKGSRPKTTEMKIRPMNFSSNTFTH